MGCTPSPLLEGPADASATIPPGGANNAPEEVRELLPWRPLDQAASSKTGEAGRAAPREAGPAGRVCRDRGVPASTDGTHAARERRVRPPPALRTDLGKFIAGRALSLPGTSGGEAAEDVDGTISGPGPNAAAGDVTAAGLGRRSGFLPALPWDPGRRYTAEAVGSPEGLPRRRRARCVVSGLKRSGGLERLEARLGPGASGREDCGGSEEST